MADNRNTGVPVTGRLLFFLGNGFFWQPVNLAPAQLPPDPMDKQAI
jgi:hypothetical protein